MASARPTVTRLPSVVSTAAAVVAPAASGVKATPPPTFVGAAVEADDLCDCGAPASASAHPGGGVSRYASASGCVGFKPR